jgi:hypothetical protein
MSSEATGRSGMSPLTRFVLAVLAWLPVTFAVWYVAAPLVLWPAALLADGVARAAFGDIVSAVTQSGATLTFATTLKPGQAVAGGVVTVDVNLLLYSFGLPLFAALTLAAREPGYVRHLLVGYAVLLPAVTFGAVADFLKNVAITAAVQVVSQTGFSALQREAIAFSFQFGSLILPAVAPAVVWVLMHRGFLERLRALSRPAAG